MAVDTMDKLQFLSFITCITSSQRSTSHKVLTEVQVKCKHTSLSVINHGNNSTDRRSQVSKYWKLASNTLR